MALRLLNRIQKSISSKYTKQKVAELVISEMKTSIAAGLSPVRGEGRFVAYKNPNKYPGDLKTKRPVNLYLSGDMLAALRFYPSPGSSVNIGIRGEQGKIAKAHNDGTRHIPRRHFMPTNPGEEFSVTITRKVRNLYAQLISDILKK